MVIKGKLTFIENKSLLTIGPLPCLPNVVVTCLPTIPVNYVDLSKRAVYGQLEICRRRPFIPVPPVSEIFQFVRDDPFIPWGCLLRSRE